jgi:hypothetical protein
MTEQPDAVVTSVPEQPTSFWTRNKARAGKAAAITAVVGLGAFALGRKSRNSCVCPSDSSDNDTAGQTDTTV